MCREQNVHWIPAGVWVHAEQIAIDQDQDTSTCKCISSHKKYNTKAKKLLWNKRGICVMMSWCHSTSTIITLVDSHKAMLLISISLLKRKWQWVNVVGRSSCIWFNFTSLESRFRLDPYKTSYGQTSSGLSIQDRAKALSEIIFLHPLGYWQVTERTSIIFQGYFKPPKNLPYICKHWLFNTGKEKKHIT